MPIITIDKLVIEPQQEKTGLIVPVTVTGDDRPDFITATFSDQDFNTDIAIIKQITIFADAGTDVSGNQSWSTEAILSESDMLELFPDGDFTKKVQVSVYKGTVNATQYDLVWKSAVKLLIASAVPGSEKITVTVDLSPHYVNENLTAQVTVCESDGVGVLQPVVLSAVIVDGQPSKTRFTGEITNLQLGKEYELHVAVENHYGVSESLSLISVMTSLDPGSVTIKNFDSLDSSGAVFDFTINAFDYSAYNSLKLLLDFKKNDSSVGTQEIIVDICGVTNPDGPNSNQSFDMNGIIMSTDNKNAIGLGEEFVVVAKLEGEIAIDASGQELRDYTGDEDVETYIMDENMGIPDVTLADIDWVTGSQTVKAVIEGSFNDVSFLFDLNGNESIKTTYDISDNKMTATKIYSFEELNQITQNTVVVRAFRPEVNGGDSVSTSGTGALEFSLKAIKREPLPTVSIDIHPNILEIEYYDIKFGFTNIPDLSYSDVFASVENKSEEVLSGNALRDISGNGDISGNATITLSGHFVPGERYIAKGYNRFNLSDAGFNERYNELNDNSEFLLSAYVMSQFVATGRPELSLEVRPETISNELKVVRMSGDLKGNHVSDFIVYARDVSGNILNETYSVNTDSIPPELLGNFFINFEFKNEISIKEGEIFLLGIIDTPTGFDGIKSQQVVDISATNFKSAVEEYNIALKLHELDLLNNPSNDPEYKALEVAIANYDISLVHLNAELSSLQTLLDGSGAGSEWLVQHRGEELQFAKENEEIDRNNYTSISNVISNFDISYESMSPDEKIEFEINGTVQLLAYSSASSEPVVQDISGSSLVYLSTALDVLELELKTKFTDAFIHSQNSQSNLDSANGDNTLIRGDLILTNSAIESINNLLNNTNVAFMERAGEVNNLAAQYQGMVTAAAAAIDEIYGEAVENIFPILTPNPNPDLISSLLAYANDNPQIVLQWKYQALP